MRRPGARTKLARPLRLANVVSARISGPRLWETGRRNTPPAETDEKTNDRDHPVPRQRHMSPSERGSELIGYTNERHYTKALLRFFMRVSKRTSVTSFTTRFLKGENGRGRQIANLST